jgi:GH15 family glucan-1,4-alpha-glucosidase
MSATNMPHVLLAMFLLEARLTSPSSGLGTRMGELQRARATFDRAIAYANDVGLLSEEVDPRSGELLGNLPQTFCHIGLINAAWAIAQATGEN